MTWSSTVPDALNALVSTFAAAVPDTAVIDGPTVGSRGLSEAVVVGWTGGDNDTAVEANLAPGDLSVISDREQYTVHCMVSALNGASSISAARGRVYALFALLGAALAADPSLGGVVMTSRMVSGNLSQEQAQQGAIADLLFDVECDAFTRR